MASELSLYLHIPFCQRKCPYCDFNTYAGKEREYARFVHALATDIVREGQALQRPSVPTLFMGGGTPTVLEIEQLDEIFKAVHDGFELTSDAEISSEANPGTVDQGRFEALRRLGVNRLSLGVQSFDADELRFLGRIHDTQDTLNAVALARKAGFRNLNLDFMFGMPNQETATFEKTLDQAIGLEPEHLSLYSLTVESGTPLAAWVAKGLISEPDPDLAADHYELACEKLQNAGYHHYEISNWARGPIEADGLPRYACRHNLVYWQNRSYLGFGPGAHSSFGNVRWSIQRGVGDYIRAVQDSKSYRDYEEDISNELAMGETMMLGLRLVEVGVNRKAFQQRFGADLLHVYTTQLQELQSRGLLTVDETRVRLTPAAKLLGNEVFAAFLPDPTW